METPVGPVDQSRRTLLAAVSIACTAVGTIAIVARVCTRLFIVKNLGKDDWAMVAGWFGTVIFMTELLLGCRWGYGLPTTQTTPVVRLMQLVLSGEVTYYFIITAIKISILLFYLRLVNSAKALRAMCIWTIIMLVAFFIASEVTTLAQCIPIEKQWDFTGAVKGRCINTTAFFYSTSGLHIIIDIWIIALPVRMLSKIHRPRSEVIILFGIFGMGVFSCVAAIVRLYSIRIFTLAKDPFYDVGPVNIWSMVEINVAIVCASVPALKPLFSRPASQTSTSYNHYPSPSAYQSHKLSNRSADMSYGLGPLHPNEAKDPKIDTKVSSTGIGALGGITGLGRKTEKGERAYGTGSREAINRVEEGEGGFGGVEVDREFTFFEERINTPERRM